MISYSAQIIIIINIIGALFTTCTAVLALWQSKKNGKKTEKVELLVNGQMTEFKELMKQMLRDKVADATTTGHAAGVADERANKELK